MKSLIIFSCLILLINSIEEEEEKECFMLPNNEGTYDYCKGLKVKEGNQCCVVVKALLGNNEYYCHKFIEGATEEEIETQVNNDFILPSIQDFYGTIIRARASCDKNVEPFSFNKCKAEESQNMTNFGTCKDYQKDSQSDYCCLFNAKVGKSDDDVYFCEEINETQAKNMDQTVYDINAHYEMNYVKYMNCSPEIPDDHIPNHAFRFNFNLLLLVYLFILII